MTDRKQFEAMLEALINEDQETAKEIFHNIVVGKSREIYEELLAEDFDLNEKSEEEEEEESTEESYEEESVEEASEEEEEEGSDDMGGDATDDFIDDTEDSKGDEEGEEGEGEGEEEIEDRVMDLEDALEELKAEFEQLMAGEEGEEHMSGDEFGADDMGGMGDMEVDEFGMGEEDQMGQPAVMEYVNKVTPPKHGDNGANAKSIVAGKNDMGGTTANIAKGGVAKGEGTKGGLADPTTKDLNSGNVNVPGAKAATKLKAVSKGHGAEKKGAGEQADNKKSIVGSR